MSSENHKSESKIPNICGAILEFASNTRNYVGMENFICEVEKFQKQVFWDKNSDQNIIFNSYLQKFQVEKT